MTYVVIFEKSDTGYGAYVPDLPGCAATGSTLEETKGLIQRGIEIYLEELKRRGMHVPEPTTIADHITAA